jgi:hypothetical protein
MNGAGLLACRKGNGSSGAFFKKVPAVESTPEAPFFITIFRNQFGRASSDTNIT